MTRQAPVASLPMYDWPEVQWAHDALWESLSRRLVAERFSVPTALDRARSNNSVWRDPGLVLSQTCGVPFSTRLRGHVRLVATPTYSAPGCDGAGYCSMIVARAGQRGETLGEMAGCTFAFNSSDSLSGSVALRIAMKSARLEPSHQAWLETGSHRESVRAVAAGQADVAAIDAVCWALALRYERDAAGALKVIGTTPLRPGLPFITAVERFDSEVDILRTALSETLLEKDVARARDALGLTGIKLIPEWDYNPLAALAQQSI